MEADPAVTTIEVLVSMKVTVAATANALGLSIADFFTHEIRDALTPDVALCNAMLDNAGLPLEVVEIGPS